MKLVVERADLHRAVDPAVKVIQRRNTIPVLNNIMLTAKGGELTVTGTDLDIEIRTTVGADVEADGAVTVPADQFADLIGRFPDGSQVALQIEQDTRLSIRCGRSLSRLPTRPADEYPDITPGDMTHRFELQAEILSALLRDTLFAASREPTQPLFNGVHLHQTQTEEGAFLTAVGTDVSRMLARRITPLPDGAEGFPAITIPVKTVSEITRLVDKNKGEVAIALCANKIRVVIGATILTSNLSTGTFPNYSRVIPMDVPHEVTVEAAALLSAVERVKIIADSDKVRSTVFAFEDRKLTLTMANQASGDLREEVPCDFEGEPFSLGFDHRYLSKLLAVIGGDTVLMRIGGKEANTVFSTREGSELFVMLAPMKA